MHICAFSITVILRCCYSLSSFYFDRKKYQHEHFFQVPIRIERASAGTIRAVPDTVKKVPGLAPVLVEYMNDFKATKRLLEALKIAIES